MLEMDSEGRSSTASTVSGIYRNILKSPAPICMFYFAHPFGVSSPQTRSENIQKSPNEFMERSSRVRRSGNINGHGKCTDDKISSFIPWPRGTWKRDYVIPPLVQLLAKQMGHDAPDLETVLKTIRQAWNTPNNRTYHSHPRGYSSSSSSNSDSMGSGTFGGVSPGPGLLRRRYSVPEIIMRKHTLTQQSSYESNESCKTSATIQNSSSPIFCTGDIGRSTGSDSNIPMHNGEMSMRRQLLRRIWNKEYRQHDARSGSWSPPMRRTQRRFYVETPERCKECKKLEQQLDSPKRIRLNSSQYNLMNNNKHESDTSTTLTPTSMRVTSSTCNGTITTTSTAITENSDNVEVTTDNVSNRENPICSNEAISITPEIIENSSSITNPSNAEKTEEITSSETDNAFELKEHYEPREVEESIISSRTCEDENRNNITNVLPVERTTIHESIIEEENGNERSVIEDEVDTYTKKLLLDNLNNLVETVNERIIHEQECNNTLGELLDKSDSHNETNSSLDGLDDNSNFTLSCLPSTGGTDFLPSEQTPDFYQNNLEENSQNMSNNYNNTLDKCLDLQPVTQEEMDIQNGNILDKSEENQSFKSSPNSSNNSSPKSQKALMLLPVNSVIPVHTGSSYPNIEISNTVLVPRSMHRTESTEAQVSTASPLNENDQIDENDSEVSLVDSLDDPVSPSISPTSELTVRYEKGEAFFVPIEDQVIDNQLGVSPRMPDKLRNKLNQRQQELDTKKKLEVNKKQKKIQKIIDRNRSGESQETEISLNKSQKNFSSSTKSSKASKADLNVNNCILSSMKGTKNKFLRAEVGLLETYTIDGRGNIQFKAPQKLEQSTVKRTIHDKSVEHRRSTSKKNEIITIKRSKTKKSTIDAHQRRSDVIKDIHQVSLYQSQSDLITPDEECGPKRLYQKTEIVDGEKRIEILEIVECIESGTSSTEVSPTHDGICSQRYKSRIPIPIPIPVMGHHKQSRSHRSHGSHDGRVYIQNISGNNTKVDQMIADLLVEALNHPKELGIEFVKSPKDISRSGSSSKRLPITRRIPMSGNSRRSANSAKYQQIFEVIPEEKSSLSVDSSNDEVPTVSTVASSISPSSIPIIEKINKIDSPKLVQSSDYSESQQNYIISSGKAAVENESTEPKAWMGFFKQQDESMDSGNEDTPIRNYEETTMKTVRVIEKPSKTIKQINSSHSSSLITPISSADILISSCSSENQLPMLDKTFVISKNSSTCSSTDFHLTTSTPGSCVHCKIIGEELIKENEIKSTESVTGSKSEKPIEPKVPEDVCVRKEQFTENVWQVPDLKSSTIISQTIEPSQKPEIDSTSFIILRDEIPNDIDKKKDESINYKDMSTETIEQMSARSRCSDCCFCNPNLHKDGNSPEAKSCNYCNQKQNQPKIHETDNKSTNTSNVYESLSKIDHTHIKTKDKDSDTVSLKCTKTNSKIRRFIPDEILSAGLIGRRTREKPLHRKKDINVLPKKSQIHEKTTEQVETIEPVATVLSSPIKRSKVERKSESKTADIVDPITLNTRRTTPFDVLSSQSYDDSSSTVIYSPSSSASNSPKKCPILPSATRWQQQQQQQPQRHKKRVTNTDGHTANIRTSRYQEFYDAENNAVQKTSNGNQGTGWSLTLAGTYRDNMAPDVEMKLSFPKKSLHDDNDMQSTPNSREKEKHRSASDLYRRQPSDVSNENYQPQTSRAALPPPPQNLNPRRTLSRVNSDRLFNSRRCNLPEVNECNGVVARQTAKKTIKRAEYTLSVASATKTVSNFSNRKRALSYQALNASAFHVENRERYRDHSIDLGQISSRRMSLESQTPSEAAMALSVLGNAIAPEQKPRVPTMSERDLTRKQATNFTRNRAFF